LTRAAYPCDSLESVTPRPRTVRGSALGCVAMIHVALVTDPAGSFATVLTHTAPRLIDGGRILVTTLATFDEEAEAREFLRGLRCVDVQTRERTPRDVEALERHGLAPVPPSPA
jgi:hypothetical protein